MKTKLILLTLGCSLFSAVLFAQSGTSLGLRAGVNFQNLNGKTAGGDNLENKIKTGFNAGVNAQLALGPEVYIQPGLLFSTKGAKSDGTDDKINISYLELPVNFIYRPEFNSGHILLGAGPYVAYALGGQFKPETGSDVDIKFSDDITAAQALTGTPYVKHFDAGVNVLAGYEFSNRLSFQLNAGLGLLKINPKIEGEYEGKSAVRNTGFGVSAGYRF
jgi:Outer membrane protein beta-barrel domain